ncbi:MAG: NUDIX hydrolase [Clostridia bacterium]|nr:NUDIX hydrolase [Clostridia bacterium]
MEPQNELFLELEDTEWPFTGVDHDRTIVRAIVFDDDGWLYFVRAVRNDEFGPATLIETSGGGAEPGEDLDTAIRRELKEELGADVDVAATIGVVSDYYNLIRRHNVNNYYLCRIRAFGERHLTEDEIDCFHLSTLKLGFDDAVREYERRTDSPLGRLIAAREVPVLFRAKELLDARGIALR